MSDSFALRTWEKWGLRFRLVLVKILCGKEHRRLASRRAVQAQDCGKKKSLGFTVEGTANSNILAAGTSEEIRHWEKLTLLK